MTAAQIAAQAVAADKRNAWILGVGFLLALAGLFYWAYKNPNFLTCIAGLLFVAFVSAPQF